MRICIGLSVMMMVGMALVPHTLVFGYTDEIELKTEEVWLAVKEVFKPYGFFKLDEEKRELRTQWIEDTVVRSRSLLPFGGFKEVRRTVNRRYQLSVKLKEIAGVVQVKINGKFQEQSREGRPQWTWRTVKPQSEDYDIERQYFFKILNHLQSRHPLDSSQS